VEEGMETGRQRGTERQRAEKEREKGRKVVSDRRKKGRFTVFVSRVPENSNLCTINGNLNGADPVQNSTECLPKVQQREMAQQGRAAALEGDQSSIPGTYLVARNCL
jgi:ribosomal protein L34